MVAALIRVRPAAGWSPVRGVDDSAEVVIGGHAALGGVAAWSCGERPWITASSVGVAPEEHSDRGHAAAVAEITDDQHVAVAVRGGRAIRGAEPRSTTDLLWAVVVSIGDLAVAIRVKLEPDLALHEPEALLRVAAVVEAVGAEIEQLAADGRRGSQRTVDVAGKGRRKRIARGEGMRQIVLIGESAGVLPRPLIEVD